jgi:hypothetical protein
LESELTEHFAKTLYEAKTAKTIFTIYSCLKNLDVVSAVLPSIEKGLKDFNSIKFRPLFLMVGFILEDSDT